MGQVFNPVATYPRTNEVEVPPGLIDVYVASPDPDPNPRGGGQLPSAILR